MKFGRAPATARIRIGRLISALFGSPLDAPQGVAGGCSPEGGWSPRNAKNVPPPWAQALIDKRTETPEFVELAGGATGAYTLSAAHAYLAAGRYKTALVLGVEKSTDCFDFSSMSATPEVIKSIGWSGDSFFEQGIGWSASDSYAEVVLGYMDENPGDLKPEITAQISSQLSRHVRDNPYAQRQFDQVTPEEVLNSRLVVYPFRELEICVYSEGAAALILAEEDTAKAIAKNNGTPVVWITGLGEANEHSFVGKNQKDMSRIMSDYFASHRAYEMAGITDPAKSIQLVELHDAFVHQLEISMAEFGLAPLGRADALIEEGLEFYESLSPEQKRTVVDALGKRVDRFQGMRGHGRGHHIAAGR